MISISFFIFQIQLGQIPVSRHFQCDVDEKGVLDGVVVILHDQR